MGEKKETVQQTKDVHVVAVDYCMSDDTSKKDSLMAIALIDRQVIIYQLKQTGGKIQLVELKSFYAKFSSGAPITALCLDWYVTNTRPIVCIGSQKGEIQIFFVDEFNSEGQPKVLQKFSFIDRGPSKLGLSSDSMTSQMFDQMRPGSSK